jgi:hypothetical protein
MKHYKKISTYIAVVFLMLSACDDQASNNAYAPPTDDNLEFQQDSDGIRLEHLVYWTGLIEEYYAKTGYYPLQNEVRPTNKSTNANYLGIGFVRIATRKQQEFFNPRNEKYMPSIDSNGTSRFQDLSTAQFITALEKGLERPILEKYDIQKTPANIIVWYNYFVSQDGYLMWVPCLSCGVSSASTLTMDGATATINIGAGKMIEGVPKAMTRKKMLAHPDFKRWINYPFNDEKTMRALEKENLSDSKSVISDLR